MREDDPVVPFTVSRNFYDVLGVPHDADQKTVRKAYKKIALESHPDRNPGSQEAEARFKEATEAFTTLNNPDKKQVYDLNLGFARERGPRFRDTSFNWDPQDIFEDILGSVRRRERRHGGPVPSYGSEQRDQYDGIPEAEPGEDVEENLTITLEEAAAGCLKDVVSKSRVKAVCPGCSGSGCKQGTGSTPCGSCAGSGQRVNWQSSSGSMRKCPACRGYGSRPAIPCPSCDGQRRVRADRSVKVRVPAGIDTGQKLRLAGMGSPGNGGPPGDLYVTVRVAQHERFHRKGSDLYVDHTVPLYVAVKGGDTSVSTLDGSSVTVQIPSGISPGKTVVTMKGAGIRGAGADRRGDLHVLIQVELPKTMTARAERLLSEFTDEVERNGSAM